jgi:RNA polymerase sigma-70 factor (ECF subfamily)
LNNQLHNTPSQSSDIELARLYREEGDMQVLAQLYQRYMELVYGVGLKYLRDSEAAKDAVMNIFEELVVKLRQHEVTNFKSWLHTLSRNHCLMQLRTPRNLKTVEIEEKLVQNEEEVHLNGVLQKEEHFKQLQICMDQLPAKQMIVIKMFYLEERSYNEIADKTGLEWTQVRSFIQNGRRNLKICMEKARSMDSEE